MYTKIQQITLKSPESICLYEATSRKQTLAFFDKTEREAFSKRRAVHLDLTDLNQITAAAAVMMFAMVSRIRFCSDIPPKIAVKVSYPKNPKLRTLMAKSGLIYALECDSYEKINSSLLAKYNVVCGNDPVNDGDRLTATIKKKYGLKTLPNKLSAALCEGLLNIHHHSYSSNNMHEFIEGRWWAYYDLEKEADKQTLKCVIVDKGVGIGTNLQRAYPLNYHIIDDSEAIKFAMKVDVTSTGIDGRGQGSDDMKHPVQVTPGDDILYVISGKGSYSFDGNVEHCEAFPGSIGGTMLEWCLTAYE